MSEEKCPTCGHTAEECGAPLYATNCRDSFHLPIAPPALPWLLGQPKQQTAPNPDILWVLPNGVTVNAEQAANIAKYLPKPEPKPSEAPPPDAADLAYRADPSNWATDREAFRKGWKAAMDYAARIADERPLSFDGIDHDEEACAASALKECAAAIRATGGKP